MKRLVQASLLTLVLSVHAVHAADATAPASASETVTGRVLETRDVAGYTYVRLKEKTGETWAAVTQQVIKKGDTVTIENVMVMSNFESKALHKTFDSIVFGSIQGHAAAPVNPHGAAAPTRIDPASVTVSKAQGPTARTVAEVVSGAQGLKDRSVDVHGKVVKFNPDIMGRNWVHLRDGSGKATDGSDDILVTTAAMTQVGDVITVRGTVRTDKDFGSGYAYKVLIEDATVVAK